MIKKIIAFLKTADLLLIIIAISSLMLIGEHFGIFPFQNKKNALAANNIAANHNPPESGQPAPNNNEHEKGAPEPPHGAPEQESATAAEPPKPITIEDIDNINYDNINEVTNPAQSYLIVADFLSSFNIDVSKIYEYDSEAQRMNKLHYYKEEQLYQARACQEAKMLLDKHMALAYKEYSEKFPQAAAHANKFKVKAEEMPRDKPHKALYFYVTGLQQFANYDKK